LCSNCPVTWSVWPFSVWLDFFEEIIHGTADPCVSPVLLEDFLKKNGYFRTARHLLLHQLEYEIEYWYHNPNMDVNVIAQDFLAIFPALEPDVKILKVDEVDKLNKKPVSPYVGGNSLITQWTQETRKIKRELEKPFMKKRMNHQELKKVCQVQTLLKKGGKLH